MNIFLGYISFVAAFMAVGYIVLFAIEKLAVFLYEQLKESYENEKFAPIGKTPEEAASVMIANTLLNIDEAITK